MGISAKGNNKMINNVKAIFSKRDNSKPRKEALGTEKKKPAVMEPKQEKKPEKQKQINPEKVARAEKAKLHTQQMAEKYDDEIKRCIENTKFYNSYLKGLAVSLPKGSYNIEVKDQDAVAAIMEGEGKKQCILNFASYKHPGGGFCIGSIAQEEALCHESFLYNVLSAFEDDFYKRNNERLFFSLYKNRGLYTPDVIFERDGKAVKTDVMTCASPNWHAAKTNGVTEEDNEKVLRQRIYYLLRVILSHDVERVILGAYGCGAFRQDAATVARIFHEELFRVLGGKQCEIVFAIPSGNGNYEAFKDEFEKQIAWRNIPKMLDWTPIYVEH